MNSKKLISLFAALVLLFSAPALATMSDSTYSISGTQIIFEGTTADAFETTLSVTDPTADNTVTLPNDGGNIRLWDNAGTAEANLVFEGATADGNETTISIEDPTTDVTFTIQGDLATQYTYAVGTVAQLPTTPSGLIMVVTDAASATDCSSGSGSTVNVCFASGANNWVDLT